MPSYAAERLDNIRAKVTLFHGTETKNGKTVSILKDKEGNIKFTKDGWNTWVKVEA